MLPYFITFFLMIVFGYFADKTYERSKFLCFVCLLVIVGVSTVICGCRDFGIGTDTNIYIDTYFTLAQQLRGIDDFLSVENLDKGFLFLAVLASKFSDDSQILLVFTELMIMIFVVAGAYQLKKAKGIQIWIFMFFYCFVFFCHSINLMRQHCAMSLLLLGYAFFIQRKYILYIIFQLLAYFFHSTSVFFLCVPLFHFLSQMENVKLRNTLTVAGMIFTIVVMSSFFYYLSYFGNLGIVSEIYSDRYSETGGYVNKKGFAAGIRTVAYIGYPLFLIFVAWKNKVFKQRKLI